MQRDIRKHEHVTAVGQESASRSSINTETGALYSGRGVKKDKDKETKTHTPTQVSLLFVFYVLFSIHFGRLTNRMQADF